MLVIDTLQHNPLWLFFSTISKCMFAIPQNQKFWIKVYANHMKFQCKMSNKSLFQK